MSKSQGQNHVATSRKVEVFRPGTFRAMNGQDYSFSEADVSDMAAGYDAIKAPTPVVVGHPKHDDPAFGWAAGFEVNEAGILVAELEKLAPEFVSAVEEGRYRKVSMKFFPPDAPNNPNPGSYYPRHIGFLGGAAPAVSGLTPVSFAAADEAELVEIEVGFAEPALEDVASLFRSVREFILEKFSRADADAAVPEYLIRWVDQAADEPASTEPGFTAPTTEEKPMSGDDTKLQAREADLAKRERALAHAENVSFAEGLIKESKLLPVQKDSVVALLDELAGHGETEISFSDDGTSKKLSPLALFKDILSAQPDVVPTGKTDIGDDVTSASAAFSSPDGFSVDAADLDLHQRAVSFQNQNPGVDFLTAVQAVQGG
jgi:hypothetical protein